MTDTSSDIKSVLLDWDDTCVATIEPIFMLHKFVAAKYYGKVITDEDIHSEWGKPLHELVQHLYDTTDYQQAFKNILNHQDSKEYYKSFFENVPELLTKIRADKKLGLVTAHIRELLDIEFNYLGFDPDVFHYIQTSDQTNEHKPNPAVFTPALEWLDGHGIQPHQVLYVGDSTKDHDAAVNAGMKFIGVTTGLTSADEFEALGALHIANLFELEDYLAL